MSTFTKICCISLAVYAGNSQAALITENGNTVSFTYDNTLLDLFGAPVISGDSIFFTPTNFKAKAINTNGTLAFDNTASTTKVTISSLSGNNNITSVNLTERGDYNQLNVLANHATAAQASVAGQIRALDISSQNEVTDFIQATAFTQTAANFQTLNWSGTASVNTSSLNTSSIILTIENLLFAVSPTVGDYAFVEKKYAGLTVTTTPVPLPAAAWLFGAALFGFLSISKRQHRL